MKNIQTILYFSVFMISLMFGSSAGRMVGVGQNEHIAYISATPITPNLNEPLPNFSILVMGISESNVKTTTMESAWWIFFNGVNYKFTLIPVYPVIDFDDLNQYQTFHDPIEISTKDLDDLENLDIISSQNFSWDHLVILDQSGLNTLIAITGNGPNGSGNLNSPGMLEGAPKSWQDPQAALAFQTGILEYLCTHGSSFYNLQNIEMVIDLFGDQIKSDIDPREVMNFWNKLSQNGQMISCEFPWQE